MGDRMSQISVVVTNTPHKRFQINGARFLFNRLSTRKRNRGFRHRLQLVNRHYHFALDIFVVNEFGS